MHRHLPPPILSDCSTKCTQQTGSLTAPTTFDDFTSPCNRLIPLNQNQPSGDLSIRPALPQSLSAKAQDTPESQYTQWRNLPGDWKYKSLFTGKTYDTSIRIREFIPSDGNEPLYQQLEISNGLLDKAIFLFDLTNGEVSILDSSTLTSPTKLTGYDLYMSTTTFPLNREPTNFYKFIESGRIELVTNILKADEDEVDEYEKYSLHFRSVYDYLYDVSRPDATISAQFKKLNHGEPSVSINLTKGDGVTDIYYAVILEPGDESKLTPEEIEAGFIWSYDQRNIAKYIKDYAENGTTNPHLMLGKVADGADSFEIPLQWTGVKPVAIASFRNGELSDMVYSYIENRPNDGWESAGSIYCDMALDWALSSQTNDINITPSYPDNISTSRKINMEYRAASKEYRLVNPYGTGSDYDYIYINAEYGDECTYPESSYLPITTTYEYTNLNGEVITAEQFQLATGNTSFNIFRGANVERMIKENWFITDISAGKFEYSMYSLPLPSLDRSMMYPGYILIDGGSFIDVKIESPYYITANYNLSNFSVNFDYGKDIHHLVVSYCDNGTPSAEPFDYHFYKGDDAAILRPTAPSDLSYRGYDADGNVQRSGVLKLPGVEYQTYSANFLYDDETDYSGPRKLSRAYYENPDEQAIIVHNLINDPYFIDLADPKVTDNLVIHHYSHKQDGESYTSIEFEKFYLGRYDLNNGGNIISCEVYGEPYYYAEGSSYRCKPYLDGSTIKSDGYAWIAYDDNGTGYIWMYSPLFELKLPQELIDSLSGVEEVQIDASDANAPAEYYNLQGMRVLNPQKGAIVIERRGNSARKIRF